MKNLLLVFLCLGIVSCAKKSEHTETVGPGKEYQVERLFTYEGCTVYRFQDVGRFIHYTNCNGQTTYRHTCGKNCEHDENVETQLGEYYESSN